MALSALCRAGPSRLPTIFQSASVGNGLSSSLFQHPGQVQVRTATKRGGGSTKNVRGSAGRRLGLKKSGGQAVQPGQIIIRQRGHRFHPGENVYSGKDHTLHASIPGFVRFYSDPTGESVGYRAPVARDQRSRKFVGVTRTREETLPRDESTRGRARFFDLIDLAAHRRHLASLPPDPTIQARDVLKPPPQTELERLLPDLRWDGVSGTGVGAAAGAGADVETVVQIEAVEVETDTAPRELPSHLADRA